MQRRTTITKLFSTFIQFSEDRFDTWMSDRRLQKSMEKHLERENHACQPEGFWTLYWHKLWQAQAHERAAAHLTAYLQEPCYWATQSITQRFPNGQWTLTDGFQGAIAQVDRILKGYRPDYGSNLRAYAHTAFSNLMRDRLRQRQDVNICSDWGLLRRLSQAQLKRSLLTAGFTETEPAVLIWQCFKAVYIPDPKRSVRALPPPSLEQFAQITERYNQLRLQLSPALPQLAVEAIAASLKQSVQAARAHLAPAVTSLNQPQFDQANKELLDGLGSDDTPMQRLLAAEVYAEQQQRLQQIAAVLMGAIANLQPADQTLLRLYYCNVLTQKEIANQLQIQQYQVSRQLKRVRQQLLLSVATWSQETLHIAIDSAVLASMSDAIHEWLQHYYQSKADGKAEGLDEFGV
ncbi:sigma-70 family RNA polymerase sigma factor [Sphaerothrix gracilis]|uniref:sigma-70 family RNA polymerase sigma factor n=1 Tax=Sphaerothrix gracilis TaxID=3151835 RepID=UPI0031FE02A2